MQLRQFSIFLSFVLCRSALVETKSALGDELINRMKKLIDKA